MRHVSVAELKTNAEELIAAAEGGEEIAITRDGRDVIRLALVRPEDARTPEQRDRQRRAVDAAYMLGQEIRAKYGATSANDFREWLNEDRR